MVRVAVERTAALESTSMSGSKGLARGTLMRAMKRLPAAMALVVFALVVGTTGVDASLPPGVNANIASPAALGTIRGSGSTFADRFYKKVIVSLALTNPGTSVVYRPIGSGKGKRNG